MQQLIELKLKPDFPPQPHVEKRPTPTASSWNCCEPRCMRTIILRGNVVIDGRIGCGTDSSLLVRKERNSTFVVSRDTTHVIHHVEQLLRYRPPRAFPSTNNTLRLPLRSQTNGH
ncbi:hypothetical protein AFLA_000541 [Aspergillus flavus NRRL3357]|nr:hypothetical protein AFLA_000541 [Aspergillus flavus NRRL3357]